MPQVSYIPEQIAGRIVNIQEVLSSHVMSADRERLADEQSRLWDEVFPGKPYEEIAALTKPFMLSH